MKLIPRIAAATPASDNQGRPRMREHRSTAPHQTASAANGHQAPDSDYEISCISAEFGAAHWRGEWRRLLAGSRSPEKIYQTPEFFRFLSDSYTDDADRFELFVIRHRIQDRVVGMIPVRLSGLALQARVGSAAWLTLPRRVVRILGSVPLMPDDPALLQQLFAYLLRIFPDCAAVAMQAFPQELYPSLQHGERHTTHVMHGWRDCHTIPLPASLPDYLGQLSAKKRYNLVRQRRLLEAVTGPLQLTRIERSVDVRELIDSLAVLSADGNRDGAVIARDYRILAANRLLLSYVLKSGGTVVGVISGSRYGDTWHVHQIRYAAAYRPLSAGAVALQAALEDVIASFAFSCADFGFGEPRHRFASTHLLKTRAHLLVARTGSWSSLLLRAFTGYDKWHAACVRKGRALLKRYR